MPWERRISHIQVVYTMQSFLPNNLVFRMTRYFSNRIEDKKLGHLQILVKKFNFVKQLYIINVKEKKIECLETR